MKQVVTCIEQEEQNGMKTIPYPRYGDFINPVKYRTVLTGIFGEQRRK